MRNESESEFQIGYKNPPLHSRFAPGKSGNPHGRPKKTLATFSDAIHKELSTPITVTEGGKRKRITKFQAIVKQQAIKAINGDPKAAALLMKAHAPRESEEKGTLSPVLQALLDIHAKHENSNPSP